jgi:hypothetical protein
VPARGDERAVGQRDADHGGGRGGVEGQYHGEASPRRLVSLRVFAQGLTPTVAGTPDVMGPS